MRAGAEPRRADAETEEANEEEEPSRGSQLDFSVLSDPEGAVKIRRLMATAFGTNVSLESVLRPTQIATLIRARDDKAIRRFPLSSCCWKVKLNRSWETVG